MSYKPSHFAHYPWFSSLAYPRIYIGDFLLEDLLERVACLRLDFAEFFVGTKGGGASRCSWRERSLLDRSVRPGTSFHLRPYRSPGERKMG